MKLLEARLDNNWRNLRVTKNNFHLRVESFCKYSNVWLMLSFNQHIYFNIPIPKDVLPTFQDKVCNSYISKSNQAQHESLFF